MRYKENTRSPGYGKVFIKDKNGQMKEVLDTLEVVVTHKKKDYTIKELLETVADNQDEIAKIRELEAKTEKQQENIRDLKKVVMLLDAQIASLKKY